MPEAALIVDGVKGWICLYKYALCVVVVCMVGYDLKEHKNGMRLYFKKTIVYYWAQVSFAY